jgi:hypothetical protein
MVAPEQTLGVNFLSLALLAVKPIGLALLHGGGVRAEVHREKLSEEIVALMHALVHPGLLGVERSGNWT